MQFTVHFSEYTFGGLVQRTLSVEGTGITGTATEQRGGGWAWFLRHADGELAGEGREATWEDVLRGIREALMHEVRYGRLSNRRDDSAR